MKHAPIEAFTNEKTLRAYYESGCLFCMYGDKRTQFIENARRLWPSVRDEFLQNWIVKNPGSRPWIWWELAPERRRRIGTRKNDKVIKDKKPHPFDSLARRKLIEAEVKSGEAHPDSLTDAYRLRFGVPTVYWVEDDWNAVYEDEADYLARLGLLLPGEAELIWE